MACKDMTNDHDYTLNLLFNKMYDHGFITDPTGEIVQVNSSMLTVFQCSRDKLIGTNISSYINYDSAYGIIDDLYNSQENYIEKKSIKLNLNSEKYVTTDVNIFLGMWNENKHIFFIFKEMKEVNSVEAIDHMCDILKNTDLTIWKIDKNGIVTYANGICNEKLGIEKGVKEGESIFDSTFPSKCKEFTFKVLQGGNYEYEDFVGGYTFNVKYNSMVDSHGNMCGALGIAHDITDIKLMERKLRENEARLRLAIEGSKIGYWDWDRKKGSLLIDENWREIIGYKEGEYSIMPDNIWKELIHEDDLNISRQAVEAYLKGDVTSYECELRMKGKNGNWIWIVIRGDILEYNENHRPMRMVGTYIDITERKEIKLREERLMKREEENKIRNEFLANISHELRTPINVIFSAVQMEENYISNWDTNQLIKYNKVIKQNCMRLIRITNNIIDTTRIDSGFLKPIFRIENIVSLVEAITLSVVSYAENRGIDVIFDTEDEEIYVRCDFNLIERIILNILSNAVKYGKENGFIKVDIYKTAGSKVRIVIKDNGIGIPSDFLGKIFGRFQRADNGMNRSNEGSGIGLSLVKSLIEIQNGSIDLKSAVEVGTEFIVEFPMSEGNIMCNSQGDKKELKVNNIIEKAHIEFSDVYI